VGASLPRREYLAAVPNTNNPLLPKTDRRDEAKSLFGRQLRVVQEMITDMATQTVAGQRHTMEKIVAFLRSRVAECTVSSAPRNERQFLQMVDQLKREAERQVPDVRLFAERTDALIALLSATT
jgi:hypothetical protein